MEHPADAPPPQANSQFVEGVQPLDALIERLPKFFTISIASKRNSGKTFLTTQLIKTLRAQHRFDYCVIFTNSAGLNEDYHDVLPEKCIMKFSEPALHKIWENQSLNAKKAKSDKSVKRKHVLCVLDDCVSDRDAVQSNTVKDVFTLGRHNHISCILISQVANWILSPTNKQNSDFILWSQLNRQQLLENLFESTAKLDKHQFLAFAEQGGDDFEFCVFDNYSKARSVPKFFMVRADGESA